MGINFSVMTIDSLIAGGCYQPTCRRCAVYGIKGHETRLGLLTWAHAATRWPIDHIGGGGYRWGGLHFGTLWGLVLWLPGISYQ